MPNVNPAVQEQINNFYAICKKCNLEQEYKDTLYSRHFKYANDPVMSTLLNFVKGQIDGMALFEDILSGVDNNAYQLYLSQAHPLIITTPKDITSLRVFPNVIIDKQITANSLKEVSIADIGSVFSEFLKGYEKDMKSEFGTIKWGSPEKALKKLQEEIDMNTPRALTRYLSLGYNDDKIRDLGQKIDTARKPLELLFADTPEDFTIMYGSGPSSCMSATGGSHGNWKGLTAQGLSPASFYAYFPYTRGAYIMERGKVAARAVLWNEPGTDRWRYGRMYNTTAEMGRKFIQALMEKGISALEKSFVPPEGTVTEIPGVLSGAGNYIAPFPFFDNMDYYGKGFTCSFNKDQKKFILFYHKMNSKEGVPINGRSGFINSIDYTARKCDNCGSTRSYPTGDPWLTTEDGNLYCGIRCMRERGYIKVLQGNGAETWIQDDPLLIKADDGNVFTTATVAVDYGYRPKMIEPGIYSEEYGDMYTSQGYSIGGAVTHKCAVLCVGNTNIPLADIKAQKMVTFNPEEDLVVAA